MSSSNKPYMILVRRTDPPKWELSYCVRGDVQSTLQLEKLQAVNLAGYAVPISEKLYEALQTLTVLLKGKYYFDVFTYDDIPIHLNHEQT